MEANRLLFIALILNSALYITGVFVAGLVTGHPFAWQLAIVTAALCYFSPFVQLLLVGKPKSQHWPGLVLVIVSILVGAAAGFSLLIGG